MRQFEKVALQPGETQTVSFTLTKRDFAYYHTGISDWYMPTGQYCILIAKSSRDIKLEETITVTSTIELPFKVTWNITFNELISHSHLRAVIYDLIGVMGEENVDKESQLEMIKEIPLRALRSF